MEDFEIGFEEIWIYARYDAGQDADLDQTRCRADVLMYENKKQLKAAGNK